MKHKVLNYLSVIVLFLIIIFACTKSEDTILEENNNLKKSELKTLNQKTLLDDNIYLPVGTKWFYTNENMSEVEFILPKDYKFIVRNEDISKNGSRSFELVDSGAGYSCSCSGKTGSCSVFYSDQVGYGCAHSTCSGSCTGSKSKLASKKIIEGVIYVKNDKIDLSSSELSSLSEIGKIGIFELEEFKNEIKFTYDFVYKNFKKPNLEDLKSIDNEKYIFSKVFLYGVEFGMVIPKDPNLKENFPKMRSLSIEEAAGPTSCSCSGTTGGACKLEKKGAFGYSVYYCNGCQTCTMN